MSDIRSFFGGKPLASSTSSQKGPSPRKELSQKKATPVKASKKRKSKVIDSDEEDVDSPETGAVERSNKAIPKESQKLPVKKPKSEDVDASSYFGSANKIKRTPAPPPKTKVKKKQEDEDFVVDDEDFEIDEDLMQEIETSKPVKPTTSTDGTKNKNGKYTPTKPSKATPSKRKIEAISSDDDDDFKPAPKIEKSSKSSPRKPKPSEMAKTVEREALPPNSTPEKPQTKSTSKTMSKSSKKTEAKEPKEDLERKAILESVQTVALPDVAPSAGAKFDYRAMVSRPGPQAAGTKEIPVGAEDCLIGLTFVFTGVLDTLDRDEAVNLVKRYGGKVTSAPSSKTNYVVLGSDAGPKKIETIRKNRIPTINEDGLLQLIKNLPAHGGTGKAGQVAAAKKEAEEKKIVEMAKEMDAQAKERAKSSTKGSSSAVETQLWTEKYAPTSIKDIIGNKGLVEKLQGWLHDWPKNVKANFKKPGHDGMGLYRAVCLSGPPGIGKTTSAHLVAKLEGYDILEYNASDTRNEKLLKETLTGVTDNTSISGFMKHDDSPPTGCQRLVLIMDEIDGMSGGDRGGVTGLRKIIQSTKIPIICVCNERRHPKLKPLDRIVYDLFFRRAQAAEVRSRIMTIAFREGLKLQPNVVDQLVEGTHSDIRQILNLLSTYRLSRTSLAFDESKKVVKDAEKYIVLKPWDIAGKFLSGGMFSSTSKATLNDKIELYFNDHEFSHLMIQENYLKTNPDLARNAGNPKEQNVKKLELAERASESISNGDLVDAMIHGSQQHWSLMPAHAVFSCVTPSYHMHGNATGRYDFTLWLGQNSKQSKLARLLREIQGHMRLRISGDRHEVRQSYMQVLFDRLVRRFANEGAGAIDSIIELMDEYYLTKDDFDSIIEISLGPNNGEELMKEVSTNAKAAFTRKYNTMSHPLAFQKASAVVGTKGGKKARPDVEDALEESDEGEFVGETPEEDEEEEDLSKDKMIKAKTRDKTKGKGKSGSGAAGGAARKAAPKKEKTKK